MRTASSARSTAPRRSDVAYLQKRLASRMLLVCLVPLAVIAVLGGYAYRLSARVAEVEILQRSSEIDRVYDKTKNVAGAIDDYEALAKQYPDDPRILVRLGGIYSRAGDHISAVSRLQRAIDLDPDQWQAYSTLAYVEFERGRFAEAIEAGEAAIRLRPTDMQARNTLAWIYSQPDDERLRNLPKAVEYAESAVRTSRGRQEDYCDTLVEVYRQRDGDAATITPAGTSTLALCEDAKVASAATAGR